MPERTKQRRAMREIVLPEREPALEWILGDAVQKVSPKRRHGMVQGRMWALLDRWARGRGDVATEWRCRLAPPGEVRRPLVPDVAFLSHERMGARSTDEVEAPDIAPDIVVEVLSEDDRADRVAEKRRVYLASGAQLVLEIDTAARSIAAWDGNGTRATSAGPVFAPARYPDLIIPFDELFAGLDRPGGVR